LDWNYRSEHDEGWEAALLDAYGAAPDRERIAHYRALWNDEPPVPG
jgi:kanamycin kinase